jgi:uncharacterized membrane protein YphA (DoxX/SURF4 family)
VSSPARPLRRMGALLDDVVDQVGSMQALALMRLLVGAVVVRHLWPDLRSAVVPVERFHVPWWSWLPVPSPGGYRVLVWLGVVAGVAMVLGLATRWATRTAFVVVTYLLFLDMTGFAHNRGFLVWLLFGLCLLPTGGAFSVARHGGRVPTSPSTAGGRGPLWPVWLLRIVVASVYLTSGLTKLVDPDWRSGLVLWDRTVRHAHLIPVDGWVQDLVTSRAFHHVLSPAAIAVEVFLGFGLWFGRTRLAAVWVALLFHASIEVAASVQTFSYAAIAALLLWVTPTTGDRLLAAPPWLRGTVVRLDWLRRFTLDPGPGRDQVDDPGGTRLVDRDGTVRRGRDAELTALSRLPLLFPVVAPVLAIHRLRHLRPEGR